ncbi:hypothetical protein D3C87_796180 [compost metagenome]
MNIDYFRKPSVIHVGYDHCLIFHSSFDFAQYKEIRSRLSASMGPCVEVWNDYSRYDERGLLIPDDPRKPDWLISMLVPLTFRFKCESDAMLAKLLI